MLHARLKAETAAAHRRLETGLDLMRERLPFADYARVLTGLHGFHAGVEPALSWALDDPGFLEPRRKLAWLERDLGYFGLRPAVPWPDAAALPRDVATAMGVLYVIEGSTLGGQVISRHLGRTLGVSPARGGTYFASYGRDVGFRWRAFLDRLSAPHLAGRSDAVVAAATATFELLEARLCSRRSRAPVRDPLYA